MVTLNEYYPGGSARAASLTSTWLFGERLMLVKRLGRNDSTYHPEQIS